MINKSSTKGSTKKRYISCLKKSMKYAGAMAAKNKLNQTNFKVRSEIKSTALGHIATINCHDIIDRWDQWIKRGRLKNSESVGCGINVFAFLSEISTDQGDAEVEKIKNAPIERRNLGTPIENMVAFINYDKKSPNNGIYYKVGREPIELGKGEDHTKRVLFDFYKQLYLEMQNGECTLIKYSRSKQDQQDKRLTPGHTVIISKINDQLWMLDPQMLQAKELNLKKWLPSERVSDGSYKTLIEKESFSGIEWIKGEFWNGKKLYQELLVYYNSLPNYDDIKINNFIKELKLALDEVEKVWPGENIMPADRFPIELIQFIIDSPIGQGKGYFPKEIRDQALWVRNNNNNMIHTCEW